MKEKVGMVWESNLRSENLSFSKWRLRPLGHVGVSNYQLEDSYFERTQAEKAHRTC